MALFGTIVNGICIVIGTLIGLFFSNIKDRYRKTITQGIGLTVILIGIQMALQVESIIIVLLSMLIGAIIGEALQLEELINRFGEWITKKFTTKEVNTNIAQAFITSTLLFSVGAMAIIGALDGGLRNDHEILLTKSALDGFTSFVLTTSLGIGVILSAIPVVLFQGSIALLATQIESLVPELLFTQMLTQLTAVGGLLIAAIGLNILNITSIRVTNLMPAFVVVIIFTYIAQLFK